jgi:glycosyltransferase involved in cell wall biosynthesis
MGKSDMNVLFITDDDIDPSRGGVKRSTHVLTRAFMSRYQIPCYLAYIHGFPASETSDFHDKIMLTDRDPDVRLEEFIIRHEIDIIVLQKMLPKKYRILPVLRKMAEGRLCKSIFVLHFSPDYSMLNLAVENIVNNIKSGGSWIGRAVNACKLATYPAYKYVKYHLIGKGYREIYRTFDRVVLLSKSYVPAYARFAKLAEHPKLVAIGNPVSFDKPVSREEIPGKKREVLIVSRFDEKQKKLFRALEIWREIERHEECSDWKLVIVGHGPWEDRYKRRAAKLRLKHVSFEGGPRDPLAYYQRASIFMMTSAYEGFALVLLESQQMGVVPIAFDTFESLHDVIEDGYNGLIIPSVDLEAYARRLIWLMTDQVRREEMAWHAVENCQKFSAEVIVSQWVGLFKEVLSEDRPANEIATRGAGVSSRTTTASGASGGWREHR